jgi:hypothetical protein
MESLTKPKSRTSPRSLINFGKAGAVQKDRRKKIGFAPWKLCDPGVEPLFPAMRPLANRALSKREFKVPSCRIVPACILISLGGVLSGQAVPFLRSVTAFVSGSLGNLHVQLVRWNRRLQWR